MNQWVACGKRFSAEKTRPGHRKPRPFHSPRMFDVCTPAPSENQPHRPCGYRPCKSRADKAAGRHPPFFFQHTSAVLAQMCTRHITLSCPSGTLSHKWERDTNSPRPLAGEGGAQRQRSDDTACVAWVERQRNPRNTFHFVRGLRFANPRYSLTSMLLSPDFIMIFLKNG